MFNPQIFKKKKSSYFSGSLYLYSPFTTSEGGSKVWSGKSVTKENRTIHVSMVASPGLGTQYALVKNCEIEQNKYDRAGNAENRQQMFTLCLLQPKHYARH